MWGRCQRVNMAIGIKPERWDTHHGGSTRRIRSRFYYSIWQTNQDPSIQQIRIFVEIFHNRNWEFKISYLTTGKDIINSVGVMLISEQLSHSKIALYCITARVYWNTHNTLYRVWQYQHLEVSSLLSLMT